MKSVVVEIKDGYAAVLSDDGSMTKIKNKNYMIGQVIVMKKPMMHLTKKFILGAASAAVLLLSTGVGAWAYTSPYTYVSLDVNPSIEYTLNRFERVIDVKAVNDDGQEILDQINISELDNKKIEDAIIETVKQISSEGYFSSSTAAVSGSAIQVDGNNTADTVEVIENADTVEVIENADTVEVIDASESTGTVNSTEGNTTETKEEQTTDSVKNIDGGIVITIASNNSDLSEELEGQIREAVEALVDEDVVVDVSSVGYNRVQEARKLGVTPGKLNLVEKLKATSADPENFDLEAWLDKPVKEIMKATKANKKAAKANKKAAKAEETNTTEDASTIDETTQNTVDDKNTTEEANTVEEVNIVDDNSKEDATHTTKTKKDKAAKKTTKTKVTPAVSKANKKADSTNEDTTDNTTKTTKTKTIQKSNNKSTTAKQKAAEKASTAKTSKKTNTTEDKTTKKINSIQEKAEKKISTIEDKAAEKVTQVQEKAEKQIEKTQGNSNNASSSSNNGKGKN